MKKTDPKKERKTRIQTNLEYLLDRDGLSMEAASLQAGLSRGRVLNIINSDNPNPRIQTVQALAELFGVTCGQLIDCDLSAEGSTVSAVASQGLGFNAEIMTDAIIDVIIAAKENNFVVEMKSTTADSVTPTDMADAAIFVYRETIQRVTNGTLPDDERERMIDQADSVIRFRAQSS